MSLVADPQEAFNRVVVCALAKPGAGMLAIHAGDQTEQRRKVDASGLAHHFAAVHIVPEKDPAIYRSVASEHGLISDNTWMIGNSPKSDILAARAAGLNAVYIPHVSTWILEQSEIPPDERVLRLPSFTALLDHF